MGHTEPSLDYMDQGATEAWAIKPHWSISGIDGNEADLEFKARFSEEWNRPLDAYDKPLFIDRRQEFFEDMDLSVLNSVAPRHQFKRPTAKESANRSKEGLPELAFDEWIPYKPPLGDTGLRPKHRPKKEGEELEMKWSEGLAANGRLAKGKLHVESNQIHAKHAEHILHHFKDTELISLHPGLAPEKYEVQAVGQLDLHEQPCHEKHVWLRTPTKCSVQQWADQEKWMRQFETRTSQLLYHVSEDIGERVSHMC